MSLNFCSGKSRKFCPGKFVELVTMSGGAGGSGRGGGRGAAGASRVLAKLNASLENGNFYEAHQMYRTLYYR